MPLAEFGLIQRFFSSANHNSTDLILGIGDDAAVIRKDDKHDYVVAVDTLNVGIHFPQDTKPEDIAYKSLAVNLSDMAAMGARPCFVTLALSLPESDEDWLQRFSQSFMHTLQQYGVALIGGDTTQGPLSISVQIIGEVAKGKALLRSGAQVGDRIYVSGHIGDAALGLQLLLQHNINTNDDHHCYLLQRLNRPTSRIELGKELTGLAHAAIDISDGLLADLGHILEQSSCAARIYLDQLPLSKAYGAVSSDPVHALSGGDDYELCFTAAAEQDEQLQLLAHELDIPLTCIGEIIEGTGIACLDSEGKAIEIHRQGYQHFGAKE